jgi:hypothetical protein
MRRVLVLAAAMLVLAQAAHAQGDPRLERLDARTRATVAALIDSARASGVPSEPLVGKALEGASRGADGARIAGAVRALAQRLSSARTLLGESSSVAELVAGASALQAGVAPNTLQQLRTARPREPLAAALVVLADLVTRGVPADTASKLILRVAQTRAGDESFDALRRDVARDIVAGAPPVVAAAVRTQGLVGAATVDEGGSAAGPAAVKAPVRKKP